MIKKTIEISQQPAHLAVRHGQLQLKRDGDVVASLPCEDLGVVVVDHPQTTYTHAALTEMTSQGAVVVLCGRDHLPCAMLLPTADHSLIVHRLQAQISITQPTRKRLWKQLVRAKIQAQADNLLPDSPPARRLREFAKSVRSGDPTNREAQAAKTYWSAWLLQAPETEDESLDSFHRDPDGDGVNAMLNYGYAIVRAAIARSIVTAGLHPAYGLFHSNRSNAFCLADDLIEPLRPMVDACVRSLAFAGESQLTTTVKAELLGLLTEEVCTGGTTGPLLVSIQRFVTSLVDVFEGNAKKLTIPTRCNSAPIAACGS